MVNKRGIVSGTTVQDLMKTSQQSKLKRIRLEDEVFIMGGKDNVEYFTAKVDMDFETTVQISSSNIQFIKPACINEACLWKWNDDESITSIASVKKGSVIVAAPKLPEDMYKGCVRVIVTGMKFQPPMCALEKCDFPIIEATNFRAGREKAMLDKLAGGGKFIINGNAAFLKFVRKNLDYFIEKRVKLVIRMEKDTRQHLYPFFDTTVVSMEDKVQIQMSQLLSFSQFVECTEDFKAALKFGLHFFNLLDLVGGEGQNFKAESNLQQALGNRQVNKNNLITEIMLMPRTLLKMSLGGYNSPEFFDELYYLLALTNDGPITMKEYQEERVRIWTEKEFENSREMKSCVKVMEKCGVVRVVRIFSRAGANYNQLKRLQKKYPNKRRLFTTTNTEYWRKLVNVKLQCCFPGWFVRVWLSPPMLGTFELLGDVLLKLENPVEVKILSSALKTCFSKSSAFKKSESLFSPRYSNIDANRPPLKLPTDIREGMLSKLMSKLKANYEVTEGCQMKKQSEETPPTFDGDKFYSQYYNQIHSFYKQLRPDLSEIPKAERKLKSTPARCSSNEDIEWIKNYCECRRKSSYYRGNFYQPTAKTIIGKPQIIHIQHTQDYSHLLPESFEGREKRNQSIKKRASKMLRKVIWKWQRDNNVLHWNHVCILSKIP